MPNDLFGPPFGVMLPPAPAGLLRIDAARQNTLVLADGVPVLVRSPELASKVGPNIWEWHILNIGPGICFVRWDGLGYAGPNDPNSLQLTSGVGFSNVNAALLTFACVGATQVTFTADNLPFQR